MGLPLAPMKRTIAFSLAAVTLFSVALLAQDGPQVKHQQAQHFMRQKLAYSQAILEGLVLEKYDVVSTNAVLLRNMNLTNVFLLLGNPSYTNEVANFQRSVDRLQQAAQRKELWPAYEEYNRVSQGCVRCHQQFRREQFVQSQLR